MATHVVKKGYEAVTDDEESFELTVSPGDEVTVGKVEAGWSYCTKVNTGEAGWIPADCVATIDAPPPPKAAPPAPLFLNSLRAKQVAKDLVKFMPSKLIEIVVAYTEHFPIMAAGCKSQMEMINNEPLQSTYSGFAVRMNDGTVTSWGSALCNTSSVREQLTNVKVCGTWGDQVAICFAAIVGNEGRVVTWGEWDDRSDWSTVVWNLSYVVGICASTHAFAALKRDGTVTAWGDRKYGGDSSSVQSQLKGVKTIYSGDRAFAAVLYDGSVVAWGDQVRGGVIPPAVQKRLKNRVQYICANYGAFAALLNDGTVATWGDKEYGGSGPSWWASSLKDIVAVCAFSFAFVALKKNGLVVTWGGDEFREPNDIRMKRVEDAVALTATASALAALKSDGSVVTWGNRANGGDSSRVAGELRGVVAICSTKSAFAALRGDGTVVAWGYPAHGGDSSAVQSELKDVVAISSSACAFAARKRDGTVVTWGDKKFGGDSSSLPWRRVKLFLFFENVEHRKEKQRGKKGSTIEKCFILF